MTLIKSSVAEDRHIAYLAGQPGGQKTIGWLDKYRAWNAQKTPVTNAIASSIGGTMVSVTTTALGILAYPLTDSNIRSSIFGASGVSITRPFGEICGPCAINAGKLTDRLAQFLREVDPQKGPNYLQQLLGSANAFVKVGGSCLTDKEAEMGCRGLNYVSAVIDTLSEHYVKIGVVAVALTGIFAYLLETSFEKQERQTEAALTDALTTKYGKIANRLAGSEPNQEIQDCANKILKRQLDINTEVENLRLPSLTWKGVENITKPVFDAANRVLEKAASKTA